jgi:hypothetical protein
MDGLLVKRRKCLRRFLKEGQLRSLKENLLDAIRLLMDTNRTDGEYILI